MMFFNPLFLQSSSEAGAQTASSNNKLSNSKYLFSDIIKVFNESDPTVMNTVLPESTSLSDSPEIFSFQSADISAKINYQNQPTEEGNKDQSILEFFSAILMANISPVETLQKNIGSLDSTKENSDVEAGSTSGLKEFVVPSEILPLLLNQLAVAGSANGLADATGKSNEISTPDGKNNLEVLVSGLMEKLQQDGEITIQLESAGKNIQFKISKMDEVAISKSETANPIFKTVQADTPLLDNAEPLAFSANVNKPTQTSLNEVVNVTSEENSGSVETAKQKALKQNESSPVNVKSNYEAIKNITNKSTLQSSSIDSELDRLIMQAKVTEAEQPVVDIASVKTSPTLNLAGTEQSSGKSTEVGIELQPATSEIKSTETVPQTQPVEVETNKAELSSKVEKPSVQQNEVKVTVEAESTKHEVISGKPETESIKIDLPFHKQEVQSNKTELPSSKTEAQTSKPEVQPGKTERLSDKTELQSNKSELQTSKPETQTSKPEMQSTKAEVPMSKPDVQLGKTEVLSAKAELQSNNTEAQPSKPEVQSGKTEVLSDKAELQSSKPEAQTSKPEAQTSKPEMQSTKTAVQSNNTEVSVGKTEVLQSKPEVGQSKLAHVSAKVDVKSATAGLEINRKETTPHQPEVQERKVFNSQLNLNSENVIRAFEVESETIAAPKNLNNYKIVVQVGEKKEILSTSNNNVNKVSVKPSPTLANAVSTGEAKNLTEAKTTSTHSVKTIIDSIKQVLQKETSISAGNVLANKKIMITADQNKVEACDINLLKNLALTNSKLTAATKLENDVKPAINLSEKSSPTLLKLVDEVTTFASPDKYESSITDTVVSKTQGNTVNGKAVTTEAGKEISFQKSVESVEQKGNDEIVQTKQHSAAQPLQTDGKQEAKVSNAAPVLNESLIAKSKTENDEKKNSPEVQKISSQNESEKPVVKTLLSDKQSGADVHQHQHAQPEVKDIKLDTAKTSPEVEETKSAEIQHNVSTNHQANETKNSLPKEKISSGNFQLPETEKTIKSFELSKEISKIIESGTSQKVVLRLLPEALGKVKLTLEVGGEIIHAKAEVENESVRQIIQTNTETLKQTLSQNGLQLASFNVSLAGSDEKQQKAHGQKKRSNSFASKTKIEKSVLPEAARKLGYNTYEYLA